MKKHTKVALMSAVSWLCAGGSVTAAYYAPRDSSLEIWWAICATGFGVGFLGMVVAAFHIWEEQADD